MKSDAFAPDFLDRLPAPPRKIVLLRTSRIGDFLCAVPAMRALRARLPDAEISMITLPLLLDLARRLPVLDRVWAFPGFPGLADQFFEAHRTVRFIQALQREHFDLAIQMQGTGVYSNTFMLLLGARATAGFVRPGDPPGLLDAALPYPHQLHEIECVLELTSFLGARPAGTHLEFPLTEVERRQAQRLLAEWPGPWIGLHPSSRDPLRRWPLEHYADLAGHLLAHHGGTIFLLGDGEAESAGQFLARRLDERCLNLVGKISLTALGALIERLDLLVTNDSGPAHIAYALGTPTVTLFNSRASLRTNGPLQPGPFRLLTPPASSQDNGSRAAQGECIQRLPVAQVAQAAAEILRPQKVPE
jgi:ADP-heptose:LPS heptosyltransferase